MSVINTVAATGGKSDRHRILFFRRGQLDTLPLSQLDALAARLAERLIAAGFQKTDRIGILAKNSIEWVVLDLACIKAGLVTAGFEVGKFTSIRVLVDAYGLKGMYADVAVDHPDVCDVRPLAEAVLKEGADAADVSVGPFRYAAHDHTTIKFTSGSTGVPKGLCASVGSIDSSLAAVQAMFHHGTADNILVFLPLSLLQQRYWVYSALAYGHDVTVVPFEFAFEAAQRSMPTVIMGVPGFFDSVWRQAVGGHSEPAADPGQRRERIEALLGTRIRYLWTGSAPANPDVLHFFNDCGVPLFEGYGMNETCIVSKNHPRAYRIGSVGKVLPNKRIRIGKDGVLIVGSDYPVNTSYLYCSPGDNENIFLPTGEVHTGDLARIDQDGYLYILGRADDLIVLANGKNVHVRRIEDRIKQHRGVGECVLYGSGKRHLVAVISPAEPLANSRPIVAHIENVNATLPADERVLKVLIAPTPFSIEQGLLTSQFKPKRKDIFELFKNEIDKLDAVHT